MAKFPESEYYLIKIFRKIPVPFFTWPLLILFVFLIASYKVILGFERVDVFEYIRFYIGNAFFSIFAILLIVIIYEKNIREINKWVEENEILVKKSDVINKLNKIHRNLFGWYQFLTAVAGVIVRRVIAYFSLPQQVSILGNTVIDIITIFLIFSLLLTFLGVILCLYTIGSGRGTDH